MTESSIEALKRAAGEAAAEEVQSGMRVGLGTGSTVRYTIEAIGRKLQDGELSDLVGVPTSEASDALARSLCIPLSTLAETPVLDLCIDGADEVDPALNLIKGLGAALLREKIVAGASDRLIIVADAGKLVHSLGTRSPLPIAVVPFGWQSLVPKLRALGAEPILRELEPGSPLVSDDGLYLLDAHFESGIAEPLALEAALNATVGVVESGLFLGMAEAVYVASPEGVQVMRRSEAVGS